MYIHDEDRVQRIIDLFLEFVSKQNMEEKHLSLADIYSSMRGTKQRFMFGRMIF